MRRMIVKKVKKNGWSSINDVPKKYICDGGEVRITFNKWLISQGFDNDYKPDLFYTHHLAVPV